MSLLVSRAGTNIFHRYSSTFATINHFRDSLSSHFSLSILTYRGFTSILSLSTSFPLLLILLLWYWKSNLGDEYQQCNRWGRVPHKTLQAWSSHHGLSLGRFVQPCGSYKFPFSVVTPHHSPDTQIRAQLGSQQLHDDHGGPYILKALCYNSP
jgi:hypothetical protein